MTQPFFSVIVPSFNRARLLPRCIESIQAQTFSDWELVLVDDGSTDNTKDLVKRYTDADSRIKYFYQPNGGVSGARNYALQNASGRFLCFLDSDDAYEPNHLSFFYEELRKRNFAQLFLAKNFRFKNNDEDVIVQAPEPLVYKEKKLEKIMRVYLPFSPCAQTVCLPAFIKDTVRFDSRLALSECYDFNARAAALVDDVLFFPEATVTLYAHTDNASIPTNLDESTRFNSRQYNEFLLMRKDSFYKQIAKTPAFKKRLFRLQMELMKIGVQKKHPSFVLKSLAKALRYNPAYPFQVNYGTVLKKITKKVLGRTATNS